MKPIDDSRPWTMKVVGRRDSADTPLPDAQILLTTAWALRGEAGLAPRGLFRFHSFEEADQWMNRMMARTFGRRPSTTSPGSAPR